MDPFLPLGLDFVVNTQFQPPIDLAELHRPAIERVISSPRLRIALTDVQPVASGASASVTLGRSVSRLGQAVRELPLDWSMALGCWHPPLKVTNEAPCDFLSPNFTVGAVD